MRGGHGIARDTRVGNGVTQDAEEVGDGRGGGDSVAVAGDPAPSSSASFSTRCAEHVREEDQGSRQHLTSACSSMHRVERSILAFHAVHASRSLLHTLGLAKNPIQATNHAPPVGSG